MDYISIIRVALRALTRNKLRSALTMLGMIIGVGAVIAMVGVGQGANEQMQAQIASMGSNLLIIQAGSPRAPGAVHLGWGGTKTLVYADETAILKQIPLATAAAAGTTSHQQVVYGVNNWGTSITGTEPSYLPIRNWTIDMGADFTQEDVTNANNVCILGATVYMNLFPDGSNPVGKTIRIGNLPFIVSGTLQPKGQTAFGQDQDDVVFIPFTTLLKKISGNYWLSNISVTAANKDVTDSVTEQITSLLHSRHRIPAGAPDDFQVHNLTDVAQVANASASIMTLLLASIASVSLLVGGIGIMNIMLVSVTERTREIGIRMAVGATESDVRRQFIVEALVLAVIGGLMGILFGVVSSWLISAIAKWAVDVSLISVIGATLFSAAIGIFFGYYPAKKAASLDPIEALRFE